MKELIEKIEKQKEYIEMYEETLQKLEELKSEAINYIKEKIEDCEIEIGKLYQEVLKSEAINYIKEQIEDCEIEIGKLYQEVREEQQNKIERGFMSVRDDKNF